MTNGNDPHKPPPPPPPAPGPKGTPPKDTPLGGGNEPPQPQIRRAAAVGGAIGGAIGGLIGALIGCCLHLH
jgi:hypothetical protein